jgi:hypothetical protein
MLLRRGVLSPARFTAIDLAGDALFKNLDQTSKAKRSLKKRYSRQDAPDHAFLSSEWSEFFNVGNCCRRTKRW